MRGSHKGCVMGMLAGIATTFAWAAAATGREGDCLGMRGWPDGCQCDPIGPGTIGLAGMFVLVPVAVVAGGVVGSVADHLPRYRTLVLAAIAAGLALFATALAAVFRDCSTDPAPVELFARALVPALAAVLVLERTTRPEAATATARLHRHLPRSTPPPTQL
jgi:hypothetical protein